MFKRNPVQLAVVVLCASVASSAALAQTSDKVQALERIEITGSNIKRISAETVAPVEIITREQIERTGRPTIAEVLRNLPGNYGSFGESFSNSFAPGAAGVSLRGLGQKTTLVLINGRRTASYGFAQNLQDTFVDLNAIPSAAVERIEILKDGASAIYGSDAIAGVYNIILRKDFTGAEGTIGGGVSEGKNDYNFNIAAGKGDLGSDKYNVFGVVDYYKRDLLLASDTQFGASRDFRKYEGGRNFQSLTFGGTWRQLTAAGALTNTYKASSSCAGTVMTGPQAVAAGLINPVGATAIAQAAATNTFCTQDFNNQFTALPSAERLGFLGRGTLEVSPTTTAVLEAGLTRTTTFQTFQAPFFSGTTGLTQTAAGLRPFTYNVNFAPGVAGNPFATLARYTGVQQDMGTRDQKIVSDSSRLLAGLRYTLAGWDLDSAVTYAQSKTSATYFNRLSLAGTSALFGIPSTAQPPIPTATTSTYNLDNQTLNTDAVRNSFRASFAREATSSLGAIDTKGSTELNIKLPGGAVGLAVGAEFRSEKLKDSPAAIAQSGGILGQGITATDGSRTNSALYAELALPVTKQLEAQLAARTDQYSDYGSSTTPKVGVKFTPTESLAIRANWGKGFRAPTLPEISPSVATFFTSVIDPENGNSVQVSGVFAGNAKLKAETSVSQTLGFVFEPSKNFSISVDAYRLEWNNVVASDSFQKIINASCPAGGPGCPSNAQVSRDPATNQVVTISSQYKNLTSRTTSGADIDARVKVSTAEFGKFTTGFVANYVNSFKEEGTEVVGTNGGSNTIPRYRLSLTQDWDYGSLSVTGRVNYTPGWYQRALGESFFTAQASTFQNGTYPVSTGSQTTFDLYTRYRFTKNLSVSGSLINVFNKLPPYDPGFSSTSLYDFSLFDPRGRQVRVSLNYKM